MNDKTAKTVKQIAKSLVKEFQENVKEGKKSFRVELGFWTHITQNGRFLTYTYDGKEYKLPNVEGYEYAEMVNAIRNEFKTLVEKKLKGYEMRSNYGTVSSGGPWYSRRDYKAFSSCDFYKPCKEFKKLTKRLSDLGQPFPDLGWNWRIDYVGGKRSWYNVEESKNYATDPKKVLAALDALKGLKKATVSIKELDYLDDRQRGIEYETEWEGSIEYRLQIESSRGRVLV